MNYATALGVIGVASLVGLGAGYVSMPAVRATVGPTFYPVSEWEHGMQTSRVTATRYKNPVMGYSIGLNFPQDANNADRAEVSDFLAAHGCTVYQGGGAPGATAYASCEGVKDKATANVKLREVLPGLSSLMADMALGLPAHVDKSLPTCAELQKALPPDQRHKACAPSAPLKTGALISIGGAGTSSTFTVPAAPVLAPTSSAGTATAVNWEPCLTVPNAVMLCSDGRVVMNKGVRADAAARKFIAELQKYWPQSCGKDHKQ